MITNSENARKTTKEDKFLCIVYRGVLEVILPSIIFAGVGCIKKCSGM